MSCLDCGNPYFAEGETCNQCGTGPRIGPPCELESPGDPEPAQYTQDERYFAAQKSYCPHCSWPFDGWDCGRCKYSLPQKNRKMLGAFVPPSIAAQIREIFSDADDPEDDNN